MAHKQDQSHLPLLQRGQRDWRVLVLTVVTVVGSLALFAAAKAWLPAVDKLLGWVFGAVGGLVACLEAVSIVHDIRRRRRFRALNIYVPSPVAPLKGIERQAAVSVTQVLLDNPTEVQAGRAAGDLCVRLRQQIEQASAMFLFEPPRESRRLV